MYVFVVSEISEVAHARRAVSALAAECGFSVEDAGRAALIATELGKNLVKHAGGGELLAHPLEFDHDRESVQCRGLELLALDKGPGMADVAKCLRDGFSTGGSPGTGLGAIERLSQQFDIFSQPDKGTVVMAQLWPGKRPPARTEAEISAIVIPKPGEIESGDAWCHAPRAGGLLVLGVDGLGHGSGAAQAAAEACRVFQKHKQESPAAILKLIHSALRSTRGAAIAVIDLDWVQGRLTSAGIGNVVAAIVTDGMVKRIPSDNGTVGYVVRTIRELNFPLEPGSTLVLHSDGLSARWQSETYPGLMQRHPSVIAGLLYRDARRGRDDSLVVVAKRALS